MANGLRLQLFVHLIAALRPGDSILLHDGISRFWLSTILFPMRTAMGDVLNLRISFSRQNALSPLPLS